MTSLPKERKRSVNLERDLVLTQEDFGAIGASQIHEPRNLGSYLDFLDELWGGERKEIGEGFCCEQFRLDRRKDVSLHLIPEKSP